MACEIVACETAEVEKDSSDRNIQHCVDLSCAKGILAQVQQQHLLEV